MSHSENMIEIKGLPASVRAEMTILGAMLVDPLAIEEATKLLRSDDFVLDSHRKIYRIILLLIQKEYAVDIVTVTESLKVGGLLDAVGGLPYLASLSEGLPRKLSIESYVRIVRSHSIARWGMQVCDRAMVRFTDHKDEPLTVLSDVQAELAEMAEGNTKEPTLESQSEAEGELLEKQRSGEAKVFVTSGLDSFDVSHGGYALGEMTVIGARPGVGKSTLLRQGIIANCEEGNFVHLFTPEMRAGQVLRAIWAAIAYVPFHKLRHPDRLTERELRSVLMAKEAVKAMPIKIDDSSPLTAPELIARARATKRQHNTKFIGVDYLQKLRFKGRASDRHIEVTDAMVALTSMAKNDMVAVALISSLTEPGGKERNRVPTMEDLRQSGDIKFEANTIILIHRERDGETQKLAPLTKFIVSKARSDDDGSRNVYFDGKMQKFVNEDTYLKGIGK